MIPIMPSVHAVCDRRRRRAARGEPAADRGKGLGGHWGQSIKQRSQSSAAKPQQTQAIGNGASLQGERSMLPMHITIMHAQERGVMQEARAPGEK